MDATQKKLVALAREGDMQLRSAAILLLAEVGCAEPPAIAAVGAALASGNAVLQDFALGYAEKLPSSELLPALVPFLAAGDSTARERAERLLVAAGAAGVSAASTALPKLDRRQRAPVAAWMAQQQGKRSRDGLLRLLAASDGEPIREAAHALAAASRNADDAWRIAVAEKVAQRVGDARVRADEATCLVLLDLAATLGRPELRKSLLDVVRAASGRVRAGAIRALAAALHQTKPTAAELRAALEMLEDPDEGVVRAAADFLVDQPLDAAQTPLLTRLASGTSPAARRFALGKLGRVDSSAVVKTLLAHLDDGDHGGRTAAQVALKQVEGAHALLVKELLACDDERRAWVVAEVLSARSEPWTKGEGTALLARLDASLERDDRLWSALLHAVRAAGLEAGAAADLDARGRDLVKKKKFAGAVARLALRLELPSPDDETRYLLATARLKTGTRNLTGLARRRDEALEGLAALERGTFPIADRLRKTRFLLPEELFYVAFNLAEQPATREAAADLLRHVIKLSPRTKTGKAARNKLALIERGGGAAS